MVEQSCDIHHKAYRTVGHDGGSGQAGPLAGDLAE
jgi:hypothetical protein